MAQQHHAAGNFRSRIKPLVFAVHSLLAIGAVTTTTLTAYANEQIVNYTIPAGSLNEAINRFAVQAGIAVVVDQQLVSGASTKGLQGQHDVEQGFSILLEGTGYQAQKTASGYIITAQQTADGVAILQPVMVQATSGTQQISQTDSFQGKTSYSRDTVDGMPSPKGHITTLLRMHPAVQFDNAANTSKTPGDLEPSDISINGAKFWQNLFMIDGMSVNNDINPGDRSYYNVNGSLTDIPGNKSQGIALDLSLIERVDVYDSNVSAEYGGFNGGVIDAITRTPSKEFQGSVSVATTRDSWTKYHIDDRVSDSFYNNPANANGYVRTQPEFETWIYRTTMEGHITETFGLLGSFARKQSDIYNQRAVNSSMVQNGNTLNEFKDLTNTIDNYFLKAVWKPNERLDFEAVFIHEPQEREHFTINAMDGDLSIESGGTQANIKLHYYGDNITWEHKLSYSELESSRTGGPGYYQSWYYSEEKNWGDSTATGAWASMYGTFGDIYQGQDSLNYKLKLTVAPLQLFGLEHRLAAGIELADTEGYYQRKEDFTQGNQWIGTKTCTDANGIVDDRHCSTSPVLHLPSAGDWAEGDGQMASRLNVYVAGKVVAKQQSWAAWVEDTLVFNQLKVRPGIRIDSDDYMDKTTVSPRFSAQYDLFNDARTLLSAGANRYYGRNLFEYKLSAERQLLSYYKTRNNVDLIWSELTRSTLSTTAFNELDIPYDDEFMAGITQLIQDVSLELKYVRRNGRDQIVRQLVSGAYDDPLVSQTSHYEYLNVGHSESDNVALTVKSLKPFDFGNSRTVAELVANWTDTTSSHTNYKTSFNEETDNRIIRYDGDFIRYSELPANNYNQPWTVRFNTMTTIPDWGLTVSNLIRLRDSYKYITSTGDKVEYQGEQIDVYEHQKFGTALTWDMKIGWEYEFTQKQALFISLDIQNVLDRVNTSTWSSTEVVYDLGRQFTLEVGYRF